MGKQSQSQKRSNSSIWMVVGAAVAVGAVLIAVSMYSAKKAEPEAAPSYQLGKVTVESDQQRGAVRNVKGSPEAKVTLTEWNDYL